jgi:hypothetical protein
MILPVGFIFVAAAMRLIGGVSYLRATIRGTAQPYPLSWLLWGITPMIAFAAELRAGVGLPALVTLALGISPLLVFAVAMIKNHRSFTIDRLNALCCLVAIIGIALWFITDEPVLAISFSILADIFSAIPTIRKIVKQPKSEHMPTYLISASSMVITLLAIKQWSFAATAFPAYVLTINVVIAILIFISDKRLIKR